MIKNNNIPEKQSPQTQMSSTEKNLKYLRRVCFVDENDYNLFRSHLIEPLLSNVDDLQTFLEQVIDEHIVLSSKDKLGVSTYIKMNKQLQKHIIYKKIYDSYLPFSHPHEFLILILTQLFKMINFHKKAKHCDSVVESSLVNEGLLVIIRFVNGLLDYHQKFKYAQSLMKLGENVNLPAWIVELRHSGTHERKLPNIHLIKKGLFYSLRYLLDNFWSVRSPTFTDSSIPTPKETSVDVPAVEQDLSKRISLKPDYILLSNKRKAEDTVEDLLKDEAIDQWDVFFSETKKLKDYAKIMTIITQEMSRKGQTSEFMESHVTKNPNNPRYKINAFLQKITENWKKHSDYVKYNIIKAHYNTLVKTATSRSLVIYCGRKLYKFDFYFLQICSQKPDYMKTIKLINLRATWDKHESYILQFDLRMLLNIDRAITNYRPLKDLHLYLQDIILQKQKEDSSAQTLTDDFKKRSSGRYNGNTTESDSSTSTIVHRNYKFERLPNWKPKPFGVL